MVKVHTAWKLGIFLLLLIATILQVLSVLTPEWIQIQCQNGTMNIGLWQYCGDPVSVKHGNSDNGNITKKALLNLFMWDSESNSCISLDFPVNVLKRSPGM